MSYWHDVVDWVGGYPFEVAKPDAIVGVLPVPRILSEKVANRVPGLGCNEFVFEKAP
jgi:2-polyprenyl-6-hydroxyphenyl methylase/3-demethylubiquinone-9 3-methyltransferase